MSESSNLTYEDLVARDEARQKSIDELKSTIEDMKKFIKVNITSKKETTSNQEKEDSDRKAKLEQKLKEMIK